MKYKHTNSRNP